jgi:protein tyrosine/serine phosphatase
MANIIKQARRGLRRKSSVLLDRAVNAPPARRHAAWAPFLCYAEMLFVDYGIVRLVYNNRHRISKDVWRSAQPAPHHLRWIARRGVKTVVNLRGEQTFGTRWLEQRTCERHGLKLVDLALKSRAAPTRAQFQAIRALLEGVEYPVLVHCKSGADRAGLMAVMVRHVRDGVPIAEARDQLSLRYGHFRTADTGVLDVVFDRYLEAAAASGIEFWDWVDTAYDPVEITRTFKARGWTNRLVNGLLKRE